MNFKGQVGATTIPLTIVISLLVFMAGVLMLPFLTPGIDDARVALNCSGIPSTGGAQLTCLFIGGAIPYFIIMLLSTCVGYITARFLI